MKKRVQQYFDNYSFYYKDFKDQKFYKVDAFDVDPISNRIVKIAFKDADFSKRKDVKNNFQNPIFIESI